MRFLGNIEAKTDAKGRIFLPAIFRKVLQAAGEEVLVMRKDVHQRCLVLYPESTWNRRMDALLEKINEWDDVGQQVLRQYVSEAEVLTLDGNGRFLIPKRYLQMADIEQGVRFIGINDAIAFIKVTVPVEKVIDPTLLLTQDDYDSIASNRIVEEPYLLLYARRYNPRMEAYAEKMASEKGWKIVDISLRASNAEKGHLMFYEAGVEEFLSLVKHAEYIITNSFHGMIMSVQYRRPFVVFSREQCDTKITELLELFGLSDRMLINGMKQFEPIDYDSVHKRIAEARTKAQDFLGMELRLLG